MRGKVRNCRKTVIYNHIDYDKLAEAIVRANEKSKATENDSDTVAEKMTFKEILSAVWSIVCNKNHSDGTITSGLLGALISFCFNVFAIFSVGVLLIFAYAYCKALQSLVWTWDFAAKNIITIIIFVAMIMIVPMFALIFRAVANEMEKEKDRNYIVAVFSSVVSFAAMIVTLVSFLKEVI